MFTQGQKVQVRLNGTDDAVGSVTEITARFVYVQFHHPIDKVLAEHRFTLKGNSASSAGSYIAPIAPPASPGLLPDPKVGATPMMTWASIKNRGGTSGVTFPDPEQLRLDRWLRIGELHSSCANCAGGRWLPDKVLHEGYMLATTELDYSAMERRMLPLTHDEMVAEDV